MRRERTRCRTRECWRLNRCAASLSGCSRGNMTLLRWIGESFPCKNCAHSRLEASLERKRGWPESDQICELRKPHCRWQTRIGQVWCHLSKRWIWPWILDLASFCNSWARSKWSTMAKELAQGWKIHKGKSALNVSLLTIRLRSETSM